MKTTLRVTPSGWDDVDIDVTNIDVMVDRIIGLGPHRVTVGDFDQNTAAAIANRLVAVGVCAVHVEGSGLAQWPTAATIYKDLLARM